ncbi:hypothetical protein Zmor_021224 [Zophobas morio]|uniref:Odorant receptor n=1 Tax=Zophobas morio TaxID=2755281 RepID=A0AA38I8Z5_9CUCU|nr:hypothetical protein Zmor_021224 [Zophobas morio]
MLLVNTGSCYVKFIPFLVNSSQIKKCIYFFGSKKFAPNNEQAERIVEDCVYVCRRNSKIYFSIFTLTVLSWNVTPIFEKEQKLAIDIWLPCDLTTRPVLFYTLYIFCAAVIFYLGLTTTPIELILAGLPYHATGQLKILEHNLCNLGIVKNGSDFRITFENAEKVLRECISLHNNILNFVGEFEDCFSWILFFQIAATTFGLCFCCIGFTSGSATFATECLIFIPCYIYLTCQLLFYCHYATVLTQEFKGLFVAKNIVHNTFVSLLPAFTQMRHSLRSCLKQAFMREAGYPELVA